VILEFRRSGPFRAQINPQIALKWLQNANSQLGLARGRLQNVAKELARTHGRRPGPKNPRARTKTHPALETAVGSFSGLPATRAAGQTAKD
jgi:hypothetical protein